MRPELLSPEEKGPQTEACLDYLDRLLRDRVLFRSLIADLLYQHKDRSLRAMTALLAVWKRREELLNGDRTGSSSLLTGTGTEKRNPYKAGTT